ncbi:hypothetical protein F5882DRAFT_509081 [Hyaloscypha sp. PMI_1271]|nr:hypothetical protein F5882DRAFT_509081 [Hyaloscypha sp. PMI_1271]
MQISLIYLSDLPQYKTEKLYELWIPTEPGVPKTNREFTDYHGINLTDARENTTTFDFETTGFKFFHRPSKFPVAEQDFQGSECPEPVEKYLRETVDLMKELFDAELVICYDWRFRKNTGPQTYDIDITTPQRVIAKRPARIVHTDESFKGGKITVERHLSEEELNRFRKPGWRTKIVTCWRPTIAVVEDTPLALCDRRSVAIDEPVPCDKVLEDYVDESFYLKYNPAHKWYWLSQQTRDEIAVFVVWDSKKDEQYLVGPPHACFENPEAPADAEKRDVEER